MNDQVTRFNPSQPQKVKFLTNYAKSDRDKPDLRQAIYPAGTDDVSDFAAEEGILNPQHASN